MSRARMALKLASRGFVGMARELAEGLTDEQVKQCSTYDRLGGPWRKVYAAIQMLGDVRAELATRMGLRGEFEVREGSELLASLDAVRDDLGAYCTNYVRPATGASHTQWGTIPETPAGMVTSSLYELPEVKEQPSDAHVVQVPPVLDTAVKRAAASAAEGGNILDDIDRLGRMACKLLVNGHHDLAAELLAI
jgi:hypothetical protein